MKRTIIRLFSTRKPKMELTIRTPYKTFLADFSEFNSLMTETAEATLVVQDNMPPAAHILPPGQVSVELEKASPDFSGNIMHFGGWLVIHPDNTCDINLIDGVDKNDVAADKLTKSEFEPVEEGTTGQMAKDIRTITQDDFVKKMVN